MTPICSECDHPLYDGEYFILTGEGTGIHHECPEEIILGSFDRVPQESSPTMSHPTCSACGLPIVHFSTDEVEENTEMHAACVEEINADLDSMEDGDDSFDFPEDDHLDGDAESALASAGFGCDEDYGYFGED